MNKYTKENVIKLLSSLSEKIHSSDEQWFDTPDFKEMYDCIYNTISFGKLSPMEENYIDNTNKEEDHKDAIKIYMPYYKKSVGATPFNLCGIFKAFGNSDFIELVDKCKKQKTAMRAISADSDLLLKFLNSFLELKSINSKIIVSKKNNIFEFIIQDLMVRNSQERLKFVNDFKNFLNVFEYSELAESIVSELHDIKEFPEHEEWTAINEIANKTMLESMVLPDTIKEMEKYCIRKIADDAIPYVNITIQCRDIITNTNSNNSYKINNINNHIKEDSEISENGFVEYIKNTKPDWYPSEGGWINIDTLYDEYSKFGLSMKKQYFSGRLRNILWLQKKKGNGTYPTSYYCKNLWE